MPRPTDPTARGPDAQVEARINAAARVILRARERAWVRVSSLAGDYASTRTLEPGEVFLVPNRSDLELWTGNAGGLEVIVDGTPVPALAGGGAVQRHVSLDPDRLLHERVHALLPNAPGGRLPVHAKHGSAMTRESPGAIKT